MSQLRRSPVEASQAIAKLKLNLLAVVRLLDIAQVVSKIVQFVDRDLYAGRPDDVGAYLEELKELAREELQNGSGEDPACAVLESLSEIRRNPELAAVFVQLLKVLGMRVEPRNVIDCVE